MTEELSQDSSRPQEAPKDSGVSSEGQLSNPTGENAVVQSSQKSPTVTNQNSQSNKKYDLGVLFVHGIGFQKPGDTFNAIYPSIKNEFNSNRNYQYSDLMFGTESKPEAESNITYNGITKKLLFRESNWHGNNGNGSGSKASPVVKNSVSIKREKCCFTNTISSVVSFVVSVIQSISWVAQPFLWVIQLFLWVIQAFLWVAQPVFWVIYFIGMRVLSARFLGFTLSVSAVYLFLFLHNKIQEVFPDVYNYTNIGQEIRGSFLWSAVFCLTPFIIFQSMWSFIKYKNNKKYYSKGLGNYFKGKVDSSTFWSVVVKIAACAVVGYIYIWAPKTIEIFIICSIYVGLSCLIFVIFSSEKISDLWRQINDSADYMRTGDDFEYMQNLEKDIDDLRKVSDKIIIISHSMGEYLSYNSIRKNIKNFNDNEVQLISIGGGLSLVSLIGDLRLSDKEGDFSVSKSACISFGAALQAFVVMAGSIFSWCGLIFDVYRIIPIVLGNKKLDDVVNNPFSPFETGNLMFNVCLHISLIVLFGATGFFVEKIVGIKPVGSTNFKFFRYTHLMDPVGNLAGFYYGQNVEQTITPNGSVGHSIRTYFTGKSAIQKDECLIKDIYMPNRSVQHIVSTAYGNSALLVEKTKPAWDILIGIISWIVASILSVTLLMKLNIQLTLVLAPVFLGFNYISFIAMLWIWKVAKVLQENPKSNGSKNKLHDTGWSLFCLIICTAFNTYVDIIILMAIDTVLSIGI